MIAAGRSADVGRDRERVRLEHRARRISLVVGMLEERRDDRRARGVRVPAALSEAIGGFEAELHTLDSHLRDLA
jgi:hypothetical protein